MAWVHTMTTETWIEAMPYFSRQTKCRRKTGFSAQVSLETTFHRVPPALGAALQVAVFVSEVCLIVFRAPEEAKDGV